MNLTNPINYNFWLINFAAYIVITVVSLQVMQDLTSTSTRIWAGAFFILFTLVLTSFLRLLRHIKILHLYFSIQTCITLAIYFLAPQGTLEVQTLYFILSAQAMLALPYKKGLYWLVVFTLLTFFGAIYARGWGLFLGSLAASGGYLCFALFGASLRRAEMAKEHSNVLLTELQTAHKQLSSYATQAKQLAISEERNRIAREMHDSLGHRLTVAIVQLEGAKRLVNTNPETSADIIDNMRTELKDGLNELRYSISDLRHDREDSIQVALSNLAQQFELSTGIPVVLEIDYVRDLSDAHYHTLYRTAQEGLTNIHKHAQARTIKLNLKEIDQHITLVLSDDGIGLTPKKDYEHYGIQGLEERALALSGSISLESNEYGTTLSLSIPLSGANV